MKFGYARVSTQDQKLDLQIDALTKAGAERIFSEHASGVRSDRPELTRLLGYLRSGDTVIVYKFDRIARNMKHLLSLSEHFRELGVNFISLKDGVDTSTANGRLYFHICAAMAEFERDLNVERTRAGLEAARARGHHGGRKPADPDKVALARKMYADKSYSIKEIVQATGLSRPTVFRYVKVTPTV